jgi:hypothetical protein
MTPYNALRSIVHAGKMRDEASPLLRVYDFIAVQKSLLFCGGIFLISFALFALLSPDALVNGDAALYAQQIAHVDFAQRTIHLGYYLLGIPFIHLLPLPADYSLNLMNCFFGALSIVLIFTIAGTVSQNLSAAIVAGTLLLTHYLFAYNALYAEVYMPQLCFFLLSLQLVLAKHAFSGGIAFACAFLITPGSLFGLPCLMVVLRNKKPLLYFSAAAFCVITIALTPHLDDYFFGGRGLLKALQSRMSIHQALIKETNEFFSSFLLYVPVLVAGIIKMVTDKRLHRLGVALIILWLTTFLFGERFGDVPAQLPAYALFCLMGGLGFHYLLGLLKGKSPFLTWTAYTLLVLCVATTGFLAFRRLEETSRTLIEYRTKVIALNRTAHPDDLVLGEWSQGILFEHYIFQKSYTGVWINTEWLSGDWGQRIQEESRRKLNDALSAGREVWLLDDPSSLVPMLSRLGYALEPFRNYYRIIRKLP